MFACRACAYEFFQHSSPAATAVVPSCDHADQIVLLTRSTPPGKGLLGLPGGFLHYGEEPAAGVAREVREEIEIDITVDRLLDAYTVDYEYKGARVKVVELVFLTQPIEWRGAGVRTGEASEIGLFSVREASRLSLAFPEQRQALARYDSLLLRR